MHLGSLAFLFAQSGEGGVQGRAEEFCDDDIVKEPCVPVFPIEIPFHFHAMLPARIAVKLEQLSEHICLHFRVLPVILAGAHDLDGHRVPVFGVQCLNVSMCVCVSVCVCVCVCDCVCVCLSLISLSNQ